MRKFQLYGSGRFTEILSKIFFSELLLISMCIQQRFLKHSKESIQEQFGLGIHMIDVKLYCGIATLILIQIIGRMHENRYHRKCLKVHIKTKEIFVKIYTKYSVIDLCSLICLEYTRGYDKLLFLVNKRWFKRIER